MTEQELNKEKAISDLFRWGNKLNKVDDLLREVYMEMYQTVKEIKENE